MMIDDLHTLRALRHRDEAKILRSLAELLAIPNATNALPGLERNAEYLRQELEKRHLQVERMDLPGAAPALVAVLEVPGALSTLGLYAHYDGQPVDESRWTDPPWEPTLRSRSLQQGGYRIPLPQPGEEIDPDSRIYARSSSDDKGAIAALLSALDLLATSGSKPSHNLVVLLEGEEEKGSSNLPSYMTRARARYEADAWIVLDGSVHTDGSPQIVLGVRGFVGMELTVYGAAQPLHSGTFGNWAPSPAMDLAHLLSSMKDENGQVTINGFGQLFEIPDEVTRSAQAALPRSDEDLRRELALPGEAGESLSLGVLGPSLNLRGLRAGSIGESARNEIPDQASASLDVRLPPGATPLQVFECIEGHLRARGFHLVDREPDEDLRRTTPRIVRISRQPGYGATRVSPCHPLVKSVASAVELAAGRPPYLIPTVGGSLPLSHFGEVLDRPVLIVPMANPDNGQHGPDENLRLGNLWYGVDLVMSLLTQPLL